MKERPILFTGAMVRALLDGTKTQTRRVVKPQPDFASARVALDGDVGGTHVVYDDDFGGIGLKRGSFTAFVLPNIHCPYGTPGDRLWVRETWLEDPEDDGTWHYTSYMSCKGSPLSEIPRKFQKPEHCIYREGWDGVDVRWRPSIHMPRWASRILLEIVAVRVERLQDIGVEDIEAEGVATSDEAIMEHGCRARVLDFTRLWESINRAGSWDANPWVWVVEFKRVTP